MFKYNDCGLTNLSIIYRYYFEAWCALFLNDGEELLVPVVFKVWMYISSLALIVIPEALPISKPIWQGESQEQWEHVTILTAPVSWGSLMVHLNVNISALHALVTSPLISYWLLRHHTSLPVQF